MENDSRFDRERAEILAKSPLLAKLLEFRDLEPHRFFADLAKESHKVSREVQNAIGEKTYALGLYPLYSTASLLDVFPNPENFSSVVGVTMFLVNIGFQVENSEQLAKVRFEIEAALFETNAMRLPKSEEEYRVTSQIIWGMLTTGGYWRHVSGGKLQGPKPDVDTDLPDVFRKFFDDKGFK